MLHKLFISLEKSFTFLLFQSASSFLPCVSTAIPVIQQSFLSSSKATTNLSTFLTLGLSLSFGLMRLGIGPLSSSVQVVVVGFDSVFCFKEYFEDMLQDVGCVSIRLQI